MPLFCGKECQCKKRCEEHFTYQIDEYSSYTSNLASLCQQACEANKELTPEVFYETLSPDQKSRYESEIPEYCQNLQGGLMTREAVEDAGLYYCLPYIEAAEMELLQQQKKQAKNEQLFILMLIAGIALVSYIVYKKS